ncbi:MAG: 1-hydroxycarotenoid 3,4-desaturase CrtD [Bacteroidota bacterium]
MSTNLPQVAIIGAGIAGLAAAVRLAVKGYQVTVFEANEHPGGKLSQFSLGDFRFDFGPSLFTMPQYVDELFTLAGENPREHFNYTQLPVVCHYWWEDGTQLNADSKVAKLAQECQRVLGVPEAMVLDFMEDAAHKYEVSGRIFLEKSLHKASTWLDWSVAKAMLKIPGLDLTTSMHKVHQRDLKHPKLVQLFNRFATYNGSNPYKAPGLLSMIPHFEHHFGAYLPENGMYDISQSVYQLGKRLGVDYRFGEAVQRICHTDNRITGIQLSSGEEHRFDQIVCNMDVFLAYDRLLPDVKRPERTLRQQKSTSAVIFYWGINRKFSELGLHNILFSDNYEGEFAALEAGQLNDDPTIYINISSKLVPTDATEDGENWFVMVNAPPDSGQDWDTMKQALREKVIAKIDRILLSSPDRMGQSVRDMIVEERVLGPSDLEILTGSHQGALYGTSSNNPLAAFLRHPNFSRQLQGLYFLGGSVHPGGGVPLCLLSAKIVAELVGG